MSSYQEICIELARRLKFQRLSKKLKQQELANRAGVALGTIKNLESKGQCSLETLVRIIMGLDLLKELEPLFVLKIQSIEQMEMAEKSANLRKRVR